MLTPAKMLKDIREGVNYLKTWRGLLYLTLLAALLNFLLAPSGTLMPLLVTKHFGKGMWELSYLFPPLGLEPSSVAWCWVPGVVSSGGSSPR